MGEAGFGLKSYILPPPVSGYFLPNQAIRQNGGLGFSTCEPVGIPAK